jgi:DNA-binding response OmpR family regulator
MKKLIIIEDDADARGMVVFTFENNGYEVIQSGKEMPIEEIIAINPHVMVIDYRVNGALGNDMCIKLKADERTVNIPLILYSATLDMDTISRGSCADGFIAKPLELGDFVFLAHRLAYRN